MHHIFDHALLTKHRERGMRTHTPPADFLWQECADRLVDKLADINRRFPLALDLGCHHGALRPMLDNRFGIETIVQADVSLPILTQAESPKLAMHPEWLAFRENSFHLVISLGFLHWVNDVPGMLKQIYHVLKPDGLFLCMIPGGDTLVELRASLYAAMDATTGGISPRLSPMIDVPDAGALLQRAGFMLPVVDRERLTVQYSHPLNLLHDLRAMGQTNALLQRAPTPLTRTTLLKMIELYQATFRDESGHTPATFDMLTLTGWKPFIRDS